MYFHIIEVYLSPVPVNIAMTLVTIMPFVNNLTLTINVYANQNFIFFFSHKMLYTYLNWIYSSIIHKLPVICVHQFLLGTV